MPRKVFVLILELTKNRLIAPLVLSMFLLLVSLGLLGAFPTSSLARPLLATDVSGDITSSITWTLTGSPYILSGTVTIAPNITLTIESGVVVKGKNNA